MKNIYIENDAEINAICAGENAEKRKYDVAVGMDIFDKRRGLKYDAKARAEYKQHCGLPLSVKDKEMLGLR